MSHRGAVRAAGPTVRPLINGAVHVAWMSDENGISGGACDDDPGRAARRALGEYVQHVSHVSAAGVLPLLADPGALPRVEPAALLDAGSPPCHWVAGTGMRDGAETAVPAQAVFLGWDPPPPEERWCVQTSAGTGAGTDRRHARTAALLEVIERHVLARGWRTGDISFEDLDHLRELVLPAGLLAGLRDHEVVLRVVRVTRPYPDIVLALLHRAGGAALTCGAAARGDTADAVRHAVYEAVAARLALGARPSSALQSRDRDRGHAVAAAGAAHLDFVERRIAGRGALRRAPADPAALLDAADALFGRQPVEVLLPSTDDHVVHRVVCHGSEVFEPLTPASHLPCPVV
ncbi:hypothetical protein DQ384_16135 [Sphaerisporangium album]|uniref:YcaO domain-containing protein n=1 Tax=Sphaerisporangium album TaxID=509200 RepID=A0A367FKT9_9ACTN|nr:YcaO-like family protein [Sphaerisporangium album]RCG30270.1 hypothetical protein DQ384_16135 [Sphaerisporangium album]